MSANANLVESSWRRELLRWGACFLLIASVHCAAALALLAQPVEGDLVGASPVVVVDFTTEPMLDAPTRDIAPGVEQVQTEAAPPPSEAKPEPVREDVVKETVPEVVTEAHVQESVETRPAAEDPAPVPELRDVPDAEVTITTAIPPPPPPEKKTEEDSEKKAEAQLSPPRATASETTAPTATSARSATVASWKRRVASHLQRFKRYPEASSSRNEQGTVELRFTMNRDGGVTSARIEHGSGYGLLDDEAVALVRRAMPLPRPPGDLAGNEFSFTVPVRFSRK